MKLWLGSFILLGLFLSVSSQLTIFPITTSPPSGNCSNSSEFLNLIELSCSGCGGLGVFLNALDISVSVCADISSLLAPFNTGLCLLDLPFGSSCLGLASQYVECLCQNSGCDLSSITLLPNLLLEQCVNSSCSTNISLILQVLLPINNNDIKIRCFTAKRLLDSLLGCGEDDLGLPVSCVDQITTYVNCICEGVLGPEIIISLPGNITDSLDLCDDGYLNLLSRVCRRNCTSDLSSFLDILLTGNLDCSNVSSDVFSECEIAEVDLCVFTLDLLVDSKCNSPPPNDCEIQDQSIILDLLLDACLPCLNVALDVILQISSLVNVCLDIDVTLAPLLNCGLVNSTACHDGLTDLLSCPCNSTLLGGVLSPVIKTVCNALCYGDLRLFFDHFDNSEISCGDVNTELRGFRDCELLDVGFLCTSLLTELALCECETPPPCEPCNCTCDCNCNISICCNPTTPSCNNDTEHCNHSHECHHHHHCGGGHGSDESGEHNGGGHHGSNESGEHSGSGEHDSNESGEHSGSGEHDSNESGGHSGSGGHGGSGHGGSGRGFGRG